MRFCNVPADEVAIEPGPYNDLALIAWRTRWTRRQIRAAFPKGDFCNKFTDGDDGRPTRRSSSTKISSWRANAGASSPIAVFPNGRSSTNGSRLSRWRCRATRVPGEAYGRGPVLLALPTIRTLNKAVELQLKSAAIQMLGIWGYRPGGAFNPDTPGSRRVCSGRCRPPAACSAPT